MPHAMIIQKLKILPVIIAASIVAPPLITKFVDNLIVSQHRRWTSWGFRWALVVVVVGLFDYWLFRGFGTKLGSIFIAADWAPRGASYYVFFMLLIPLTHRQTTNRIKRLVSPRGRFEMRAANVCLNFMFYFLAIQSFALGVLPSIPSSKGGGDYTDSPTVVIKFKSVPLEFDARTLLNLQTSNRFVVIERTPDSIFVADIDSLGRDGWKKIENPPEIFEICTDSISGIFYTQQKPT